MSILLDRLEWRIRKRLRVRVQVSVHDNRSVMMSFRRPRSGPVQVRLHHMFLAASSKEIRAIARFVRSKHPAARDRIESYIDDYRHLIGVKVPDEVARPGKGKVYDLHKIYRRLNRLHFRNRVHARIEWAPVLKRERRRTIRLGLYCEGERRITISRALDRKSVPLYVVEWIVFHEMLHQIVGFTKINGAYVAHTPEFKAREAEFPEFERASRWETRNLDRLLRL